MAAAAAAEVRAVTVGTVVVEAITTTGSTVTASKMRGGWRGGNDGRSNRCKGFNARSTATEGDSPSIRRSGELSAVLSVCSS